MEETVSLSCSDCGLKVGDAEGAQRHGIETGHANFEESSEIVKLLTEEEKKERLEALKIKMMAKNEHKRLKAIEDDKLKEKEMQATKERMQAIEMQKQALERQKDKEDELRARQRVREQLEADKLERIRIAEEKKRIASGVELAQVKKVEKPVAIGAAGYGTARIQVRLPSGPITSSFSAEDPLKVVYDFVASKYSEPFKLVQTFPRKVLEDQTVTLKELGLVPSGSLIVQ